MLDVGQDRKCNRIAGVVDAAVRVESYIVTVGVDGFELGGAITNSLHAQTKPQGVDAEHRVGSMSSRNSGVVDAGVRIETCNVAVGVVEVELGSATIGSFHHEQSPCPEKAAERWC